MLQSTGSLNLAHGEGGIEEIAKQGH